MCVFWSFWHHVERYSPFSQRTIYATLSLSEIYTTDYEKSCRIYGGAAPNSAHSPHVSSGHFIHTNQWMLYCALHAGPSEQQWTQSFTPDSKYIISGINSRDYRWQLLVMDMSRHTCTSHTAGSQDGMLHVWSVKTGEPVVTLDGGHPSPTHCVQCNPKYLTLASAWRNLVSYYTTMRRIFGEGALASACTRTLMIFLVFPVPLNCLLTFTVGG